MAGGCSGSEAAEEDDEECVVWSSSDESQEVIRREGGRGWPRSQELPQKDISETGYIIT